MLHAFEKKPKTPRNLPVEIKRKYRNVFWQQFWKHENRTPVHLWDGSGIPETYREGQQAKALCGKVLEYSTLVEVPPEESGWLCKACIRIALKRERNWGGARA